MPSIEFYCRFVMQLKVTLLNSFSSEAHFAEKGRLTLSRHFKSVVYGLFLREKVDKTVLSLAQRPGDEKSSRNYIKPFSSTFVIFFQALRSSKSPWAVWRHIGYRDLYVFVPDTHFFFLLFPLFRFYTVHSGRKGGFERRRERGRPKGRRLDQYSPNLLLLLLLRSVIQLHPPNCTVLWKLGLLGLGRPQERASDISSCFCARHGFPPYPTAKTDVEHSSYAWLLNLIAGLPCDGNFGSL